jgi:hypothetical protein
VLVLDDLQDAAGPLTAVKLAEAGASVRLVTRWPMFGMETIPEVYFIWIQSRLYEAGVELTVDHFVERIDRDRVTLFNVYQPDRRERSRRTGSCWQQGGARRTASTGS